MVNSLGDFLNNRNAVLVSLLVLLALLGLTAWQWTWWSNAIDSEGKDYRVALKFDESNAKEFPYAVKTQQGKLYAKGNITSPDKLLTDTNIDGEWLAIRKVHQEYRPHAETYACHCKPKKGCDVCTRTVWDWEFDRNEDKTVSRVILLGQMFNSSLFDWKQYKSCKIKQANQQNKHFFMKDDTYIKTSPMRRYRYETVANRAVYEGGFVSDHKGIRSDNSIRPASNFLSEARIFITVLLVIGSVVASVMLLVNLYQRIDFYDR